MWKHGIIVWIGMVGLSGWGNAGELRVESDGSGNFGVIQEAIDAAVAGDVIIVGDGTWTGNGNRDLDLRGKAITVCSQNGPEHCVIDCAASESDRHRGFVLHSAEGRNSVIEGFTITNGVESTGAGILCTNGASPTIRNNIIRGNRVLPDGSGGGIACCESATPVIEDNIIEDNHCELGGGGIFYQSNNRIIIRRNIIRGNSAGTGGAIETTDSGFIENNLIEGNTAGHAAGIAVRAGMGPIRIRNNTIVNNTVQVSVGGIWVDDGAEAVVTLCILWGNTDTGISVEKAQIDKGSAYLHMGHCCVQGWSGITIYGLDPQFVDAAAGDYHLSPYSPCIDSGILSMYDDPDETDLDGNPRVMREKADMGAYEVPPAAHRCVYQVIDLGTLGGLHSEAKAINYEGEIVGSADTEAGIGHACYFSLGNIDLGTLGGLHSEAEAINYAGQIVGSADTEAGIGHACRFVLGGNIDLGMLGGQGSIAYGINDHGRIVGATFHPNGRWRATLFDATGGGANINLGNLGEYAGNDDSVAIAINFQGIIVGQAQYQQDSGILMRAALFDPTGGGANVHLGGSSATALNKWHIVGSGNGQAMLFDATGRLKNRTLGLPEGALRGQACGINERGEVVGSVTFPAPGQESVDHAAIFDAFGRYPAIDLNTVIDSDSGWVLLRANGINDKGEIVGLGINPEGNRRAFQLVPDLEIIYVDDTATGANNGSSWGNALTHLEAALEAEIGGTEIRVAQGVYGPEDPGEIYWFKPTFELKTGVVIKGGYAGAGAVNPDARDTAAYASILRGGVSGNLADEETVLDGVTITGSGMCNMGGTGLTVIGCTFEGNTNSRGAVTNIDTEITFIDCIFRSNRATGEGGGAIWNDNTDMKLIGCTFTGNVAERYGGAIWSMMGQRTVLVNCVFTGNSCQGGGGAICCNDGAEATLTNCTFVGNRDTGSAAGSGGICGSASVRNCIFWGNTCGGVADEAAQIDVDDESEAVNYNCIQGWTGALGGVGNMGSDPLFADPGRWDNNETPDTPYDDIWINGDYHLKSQAGRWNAKSKLWINDEVTSPCIDAGDPYGPIGLEPFPNGGVANLGFDGGTAEASKSWFGGDCAAVYAGDINGDCRVDLADLAILSQHWLGDGSGPR